MKMLFYMLLQNFLFTINFMKIFNFVSIFIEFYEILSEIKLFGKHFLFMMPLSIYDSNIATLMGIQMFNRPCFFWLL